MKIKICRCSLFFLPGRAKDLSAPRYTAQTNTDWLWVSFTLVFSEYRCSFPRVKMSGSEVDHLQATSVGVKNAWRYVFIPAIRRLA